MPSMLTQIIVNVRQDAIIYHFLGVLMTFYKLTGISVGADLSRTPPIYRPSVTFHDLLNFIIGPNRVTTFIY